MRAFRVREFVAAVGSPDAVIEWRNMWLERGVELLSSLGLPAKSDVAADPFFGRGGRMLAASQKEQKLKFEVLIPVISEDKPTAVCSFNYHQEHFGKIFEINTPDGAIAQTACLGFGIRTSGDGLVSNPWLRAGGSGRGTFASDCGHESKLYLGSSTRRTISATHCTPSHELGSKKIVTSTFGWRYSTQPSSSRPRRWPSPSPVIFDGDQWTFKQAAARGPQRALWRLKRFELNVWKPILEHALFHTAQGRLVFTEADAFWLPDTQGTDYRAQHTKTTIVLETIDVEAKKLGYFHNAGYFQLEGEDFVKTFRLDAAPDPTFMPLFAELVEVDRVVHLPEAELASRSRERQLRAWLARRPLTNPIPRFGRHLAEELDLSRARRTSASIMRSPSRRRTSNAVRATSSPQSICAGWSDRAQGLRARGRVVRKISNSAKALILKRGARGELRKPVDFGPIFEGMANDQDNAMSALDAIAWGPLAWPASVLRLTTESSRWTLAGSSAK